MGARSNVYFRPYGVHDAIAIIDSPKSTILFWGLQAVHYCDLLLSAMYCTYLLPLNIQTLEQRRATQSEGLVQIFLDYSHETV
jgi:hypothetical protein